MRDFGIQITYLSEMESILYGQRRLWHGMKGYDGLARDEVDGAKCSLKKVWWGPFPVTTEGIAKT